MKSLPCALLIAAALPSPADACAIKDNDVAIVVGVVGGQVATLRIALHEQERPTSETDTQWSGQATLVIGTTATSIGRIDPQRDPELELDRLTTLAHDHAKKLAGFQAATQIDQRDCSETPGARCGSARLDGTTLHVAKTQTIVDAEVAITGVVRYRAGDTEISVVNIGHGDPRFTTVVRPCSVHSCRTIPTLHHGEQKDIVVVTRRGA